MSSYRLRRPVANASLPTSVDPHVTLARLRLYACFLAAMLAALMARLWFLQVRHGGDYKAKASLNRSLAVRSVAPRGAIEDARGRVLVTNSAQFTVFVQPADLPKKEEEREVVLKRLANILKVTLEDLKGVMKRNGAGPSHPIAVAENVDDRTLASIAENSLWLPGVAADVEPVRRYPQGQVAAHLLGYVGQISSREYAKPENRTLGYQPGDMIGKDGIERAYDHLLNGEEGATRYEVDARGRRQRELDVIEPIPGATLRLGLNLDVQRAAERALGQRKGAAVAVDPRDGRVIAMVSRPSFDPNLLARRPLRARVYKEQIEPGLFNRATMSAMPPGSTFKIVTSAAGLAEGKIDGHTGVTCRGGLSIGRGFFKRCHHTHGGVDLNRALAVSCDVYYYKVAEWVGPTRLAEWAKRFGLGQKTGIDLPAEEDGIVPSPAWKLKMAPIFKNPDPRWYPGDTANVAIGQGDVLTTPLQMALVAGAIGNGGYVYEPRVVVEAVSAADKKVVYRMKPRVAHELGLTSSQIALIADGLRAVVGSGYGTSRSANLPGIAVAGKSGSAELRGTGGGKGATHGWFVCYAPMEKPTIAICVLLQSEGQNYHGGADAAPVARQMLASHFGIQDSGVLKGARSAD